MPDLAIQKLRADFLKPKKPEGWQTYRLETRPGEPDATLDALFENGRVKLVHNASVRDYHVKTTISNGRLPTSDGLDLNWLTVRAHMYTEKAKKQLPEFPAEED